ncbi:hypothetical protein [Mesobacillus jeotgali]|uniref:Glycine zipper family protein n=1 Tax=Mesobacillus jeotgali TaxID=129985 RepID=A0ABY9VIF3_9BACI|nr:hypothetical protein [Mesobacillus jeotgali]WNF22657.1 hypothetical protein RH061_21285 [Mesobacillus jeotgali]
MNKSQWELFVHFWENGKYEEAVEVQLESEPRGGLNVVDKLFRSQGINSSATIAGFSFMDILYDYFMINPAVMDAIDFARSEDLASFFTFQQFAAGFDFDNAGELTRLKGYTAEQLVALELQGKGHDVSFPEASNQAGFDLIVDGQPFQVKCLGTPGGVYEHFRAYPDLPVLVNRELIPSLADHPLVYGTDVSNQTVEVITRSTLKHAAEFTELDIPMITLGISSLTNGYKVIRGGISTRIAGLNIANETAARGAGALAGKGIGLVLGPLFGPAGTVVLPMMLGMAGGYSGKKLTKYIKQLYTQKERDLVFNHLGILIGKVLQAFPKKETIKESKFQEANTLIKKHPTLRFLTGAFTEKHKEKLAYLINKKQELNNYQEKVKQQAIDLESDVPHILDTILKSQVHPSLFQKELTTFGESYNNLKKI